MKFKDVVEATPNLQGKWETGLGALRAEDKPHIKPDDPRRLSGSVDIDKALGQKKQHANANRWDFAIAYQHTNRDDEFVYWVEIHTADERGINEVLKKLDWLKKWLKGDGKELEKFKHDFIWISSGATTFTRDSKTNRKLIEKGLQYKGSKLQIRNERSNLLR